MAKDVLSIEKDNQDGEPLMQRVMEGGRQVGRKPTLAECRQRPAHDLEHLSEALQRLGPGACYPVQVANVLEQLAAEVDSRVALGEGPDDGRTGITNWSKEFFSSAIFRRT
jgi:nicotinate phosphoribosyltransferase